MRDIISLEEAQNVISAEHLAELEINLAMFDADPDASVVVDQDGNIIRFNSSASLLFGYSKNYILGNANTPAQKIELLVPKLLQDSHQQYRREYSQDPTMRPMGMGRVVTAIDSYGEEIPVDVRLSPFVSRNRKLIRANIRRVER